jgi:hypothetical protein
MSHNEWIDLKSAKQCKYYDITVNYCAFDAYVPGIVLVDMKVKQSSVDEKSRVQSRNVKHEM